MPTYEYRCPEGHDFELFQKMSDKPRAKCPVCGKQAVRQISGGAELTIDRDRDKNPVVALREIAEETVHPVHLEESVVSSLQRVQIDDEEAPDELGSLSQSAEALRLTAAAPPRNQNLGGDYDG